MPNSKAKWLYFWGEEHLLVKLLIDSKEKECYFFKAGEYRFGEIKHDYFSIIYNGKIIMFTQGFDSPCVR